MDQLTDADRIENLLDTPNLADALESERFKQFMDHVPVAIAVSELRPNETIVYANLEFERLMQRAAGELQGGDWNGLPGIASEQGDDQKLGHAIETGEEYIGRFTISFGESGGIVVNAWSNTIQDDDGIDTFRLVALAAVGSDRGEDDELERRLRDSDDLLRELQHRVKNNLQMITALIRMEARNLGDEDTGKRFDRLAGRINALSVLYDCLSSQSQSGETIDLGVYLSQIASSVMQAHAVEGIRLDLTVDTWPVSINVAMPAGLVVNELMTNSLKHGFAGREGGTIRLHSLIDGQGCHITVADDGVGLPEGVSWPKPGKLGAAIAQSLQQNAGAKLTVNSEPGAGVEVTMLFARDAAEQA